MKALLLAVASALLLIAAQAPLSILPAALVGLLPLVALADLQAPARRIYGAAYLGGALFFGLGCHWLAYSSPWNLLLMTVAEATAFPLFVWLLRVYRQLAWLPRWLAVALAWVAVEYLRSRAPFGGFPWLLLGYAADRPRILAQCADLAGVHGLSFAFAAVNGLLLGVGGGASVTRRRLAAAALITAMALYGHWRIPAISRQQRGGPTVALVQGNIAQDLKNRPQVEQMWEPYLRLSRQAVQAPLAIDLLVWPETMFPEALNHARDPRRAYRELERIEGERIRGQLVPQVLQPTGAHFLLGALTLLPDAADPRRNEQFNSAILFDAQGNRRGIYDKAIRVPGGEFIPLRRWLPDQVERWVLAVADFLPNLTPGGGPALLEVQGLDGVFRFAPTICYENTYSDYGARAARLGADFLLNLSNEGWFKDSVELDQMEVASRFRAIEVRRSLVRSTNTGITAVYDAVGERIAAVVDDLGRDREIEGLLVARVPICVAIAPYVAVGDALPMAGVALAGFLCLAGLRRRYPRRRST